MLIQLAAGTPLRGGVDVGTGIEVEGELFGAACVKAYELEKNGKYPRLVVGNDLVGYLRSSLAAPGAELERQFGRKMARGLLDLVKKDDFDGKWIVDYAGRAAHEYYGPTLPKVLSQARAFAHRERGRFQGNDDKLFGYYSQLVRYLDAAGP